MSNIEFEKAEDVYQSTNYDLFKFITFNRLVATDSVRGLLNSIERWGNLGVLVVVVTKSITGTLEYYIIDGQHRFKALKEKGLPIKFVLQELDSVIQIADLMSVLNNTQKAWLLEDYLRVFSHIGIDSYRVIKAKYEQTGIQLSLLIAFYALVSTSGSANKSGFKQGTFDIPDLAVSLSLINTYKACLPYVSQDYFNFLKGFAEWIIMNRPNHNKLLKIVQDNEIPEETTKQELDRLYFD